MIVVDTSALMAVLLQETEGRDCTALLEQRDQLLISAGTFAEAMIVSARRHLHDEMIKLIDGVNLEIVDVTAKVARNIGRYYQGWGKGFHPAALNYGDCFAYALAKERDCPLLYVGKDLARTDIRNALDEMAP